MLQATQEENRVIQRISMQLPVKVEVRVDAKMTWEEIARIRDVSRYGAGFALTRPVKRGRLVFITIPMPRSLRTYDFAEPQYKIWGIVRRCIKFTDAETRSEKYSIGVGFVGKEPPKSYWVDPATIYEIVDRDEEDFWKISEAYTGPDTEVVPAESRRHSRFRIPTNVTVDILDGDGEPVASEDTVTENLSLSGASIYTSFSPSVGDFLRISSTQYNVTIISIVRGVRVGEDNIQRLHIEFIDRFFPLEGIEHM
ncbi:MAG: PilZ domain-containing protein [Pyrinomonadaceae bacterium]|nr:PilZ domain-containing protein [Pyrinomonadaceae bacterium]